MYRVKQAVTKGRRRFAAVVVLACASIGPAAQAAPATEAGTRIVNVAGLRYDEAGRTERVSSNVVTLTVAEVLDVTIMAPAEPIVAPVTPSDIAVPFIVSNPGNAAETFAVAARADRADATITGIVADANDNGVFDPASDPALADGAVSIATGRSKRLFVLVRRSGGEPVTVTATATATTGHGEPGAVYPGAGADGGDAIVGRTGAAAAATARIVSGAGAPSLAKSQSVVAPDGSDRVMPGSIVTYRLDARFPGPAVAVEIDDPIPPGTLFVPGSIRIDGDIRSDAADDDAATFDGTAVRVTLGDVVAASTRSIQFDVKIQ